MIRLSAAPHLAGAGAARSALYRAAALIGHRPGKRGVEFLDRIDGGKSMANDTAAF
jgi:hypothetical protein